MTAEEKKAYHRAYYLKNRDKIKAQTRAYAVANAESVAAYQRDYRARNRERRAAYRDENRERIVATERRWYAANAEQKRASAREWGAKNRERKRAAMREYMQEYSRRPEVRIAQRHHRRLREYRERGAKGHATAEQIEARCAYYGHRCVYCGEEATTIDHVIPIVRGGTNWPANLRPACHSCNSSKRDTPLAEFLERKWASVTGPGQPG